MVDFYLVLEVEGPFCCLLIVELAYEYAICKTVWRFVMSVWSEALKIFTFGFSSVFFILGALSLSVVITRTLILKFGAAPKKG